MEKEKKKILIVEDEKPLAHALELKLTFEGFDVKSVSNGEEAAVLLEKEIFSLVICDLVMPKMDGFQLLQFIKDKKINLPVIVLSNLSQNEDEKRARELGASDFFIKSNIPISDVVNNIKTKILNQ